MRLHSPDNKGVCRCISNYLAFQLPSRAPAFLGVKVAPAGARPSRQRARLSRRTPASPRRPGAESGCSQATPAASLLAQRMRGHGDVSTCSPAPRKQQGSSETSLRRWALMAAAWRWPRGCSRLQWVGAPPAQCPLRCGTARADPLRSPPGEGAHL